MKHLGDITKINGAEAEPVEVIIGGSPCQDLSVAGKRAGLDGERSGLFMEQIRIIKEMRENDRRAGRTDEFIRPRFMVWENVPGAFSSNGGEDFRIVLEETAKIADPEISIPRPPHGKWTNAGCIMGRGYSIAWRVLDAQYFGVPQRRRRIALVADFGGETAPEILFKPESLSGDIEPSGTERERTAGDAGTGVAKPSSISLPVVVFENHSQDSRFTQLNGVCQTVTARYGMGGNNQPLVVLPFDTTQITSPLNGNHPHYGDPCHPLAAGAHVPAVAINGGETVRRLTSLECERLQGYPDHWTDIGEWTDSKGKKHKAADSPRYKALGNSIAVPCWRFILRNINEHCTEHTMASLFAGIGGFELCSLQVGIKPIWNSEVEEFCIAVTKKHFGNGDEKGDYEQYL